MLKRNQQFTRNANYVFSTSTKSDDLTVSEFTDCPNCFTLSEGCKKVWNRRATPEQRTILFADSEGYCHYCDDEISFDSFHADHVRPWAYSHNSDLTNLVAACYKCNIAKHTLSYERYTELLAEKGIQWRNRKYYMTSQNFQKPQPQLVS
jgi:hypothetical protein